VQRDHGALFALFALKCNGKTPDGGGCSSGSSGQGSSSKQSNSKRLRGRLCVEARLHILTAVYGAITHRVYVSTSPLQSQASTGRLASLSSISLIWSSSSHTPRWSAITSLSIAACPQLSSAVSPLSVTPRYCSCAPIALSSLPPFFCIHLVSLFNSETNDGL
jgi:hypothetical protein